MDVVGHLNSALYLSQFFGLAPYKYNLALDKQLLWYSLFLVMLLIAYWPAEICLAFSSEFFSIAHWTDVVLLSITYMIAVYKSITNAKQFQKLVDTLNKVDNSSSLKCFMKKSYVLRLSMIFILCISLIDSLTSDEKLRFWEYMPIVFILALEDQFKQTILIISTRLDALSSLIGKSDPVKLVRSYNFLFVASKIVNKMYALQIFSFILSVFVYIVTGSYLLTKAYLNFLTADTDSKIDTIIYTSNFILRLFQVFFMCHAISSVVNKCEKFHSGIARLMENDSSEAMYRNDKLQLHIIMNSKMTFSCFGYFDLNYSLLQMISSTTAIYVAIIIQLDMSCSCSALNLS